MEPDQLRKSLFNLKEIGKKAAQEAEKEIIQATLRRTHWNRKKAAKLLKISYKTILYKIRQYQLERLLPVKEKE